MWKRAATTNPTPAVAPDYAFEHEARLEHGGSPQGKLTLSLGVSSCIPTQQDASHAFLESTDRALYEAKHNGRDRVEVADPA